MTSEEIEELTEQVLNRYSEAGVELDLLLHYAGEMDEEQLARHVEETSEKVERLRQTLAELDHRLEQREAA